LHNETAKVIVKILAVVRLYFEWANQYHIRNISECAIYRIG